MLQNAVLVDVGETATLQRRLHHEKIVLADEEDNRASRPWSKEDVKELKSHLKARTPVAKIAKTMKRTEGALRLKAGMIGIGLGHDR
jgi:hypothetical protein